MIRAGAKEPDFEGLERVRNLLLSGKTGAKTDEAGVTVELSSNGFLVYAGDTRHEDKPDAWNLLQIIYKTICPKWVDNIHKTDIIGNNDTENCQKLGRWFMETRLLDKAPLHLEKYQYLLDADKVGTIRLRFPQRATASHLPEWKGQRISESFSRRRKCRRKQEICGRWLLMKITCTGQDSCGEAATEDRRPIQRNFYY